MIDFPAWFSYGCYGGLACCMLAVAACALSTVVRKRGTTRQLVWAIITSVISALLLTPALFWYNLRFNSVQAALSAPEIGFMLFYVAFCGWIVPLGITTVYCLFTHPRASHTAGHLVGQRIATTELGGGQGAARQAGKPAPYVYSADRAWGWLVYHNGNFTGQELALKRSVASIGREEDNEVWLDDDTISRYHAELVWDKGQIYITDNESLNGVLLNGRRIRTPTLVKSEDELIIGAYHFLLKCAPQRADADELSDPFLPQIRKVSHAGNNLPAGSNPSTPQMRSAGITSPGSNPRTPQVREVGMSESGARITSPGSNPREVGRQFTPIAAPGYPQGFAAEVGMPSNRGTAWQKTAELADRTPLPLSNLSGGLCIIRSGEMLGRSFLLDRPLLTVGRDAESDISIPDPSISRRHAQFLRQMDGDYIQDLASHNGSQINGRPLNTPHLLRPGDVITLGEVRLEYLFLPEAQTTPMPLMQPPPTPFSLPPSLRLPSRHKN